MNLLKQIMLCAGDYAARRIINGDDRTSVLNDTGKLILTTTQNEYFASLLPSVALVWAQCGFPAVEPAHKLAASLMATSVPQDILNQNLFMPWRCFGIHLPPGLLHSFDGFAIFVTGLNGLSVTICYFSNGEVAITTDRTLSGLAKKVHLVDNLNFITEESSKSSRRFELAGRLFTGICLELNQYRRSQVTGGGRTKRNSKTPTAWSIKLTRNVNVDARSAVRSYLECGGVGPNLQIMVRGHWRNQPHGAASLERRLIHIEPYWKGPEQAIIAVRNHCVGESL